MQQNKFAGEMIAKQVMTDPKDAIWKTKRLSYEGLPLYLRYQEDIDIKSLSKRYTKLVTVTHSYSRVMTNGLPEPEYNRGLFHFDMSIRKVFDGSNIGFTPLIETFGGQRHYYIYVAENADVEAIISEVRRDFPFDISFDVQSDPDWNFFKEYSKEFLA